MVKKTLRITVRERMLNHRIVVLLQTGNEMIDKLPKSPQLPQQMEPQPEQFSGHRPVPLGRSANSSRVGTNADDQPHGFLDK